MNKAKEMGNLGSVEKLAGASVIVYFMCQLDWTTRCPDVWSNVILGGSVKVFLDEVSI